MTRWCATFLLVAACSPVLRADVTIVQVTTMEGGMMAMMPGAAAPSPTVTMKIKGLRARTDVETATAPVSVRVSTITDLATKQVILLMHDQKAARVVTMPPAGPNFPNPADAGITLDSSVTRTGKSQTIDGFTCDEYSFTTSINMANAGGPNVPPDAAAAMQGLTMRMNGAMWVAQSIPGAAEYSAFQKAMAGSAFGPQGLAASGVKPPGMESLLKAMSAIDGLVYLTEVTLTVEGTGQVADMMRKTGAMKLVTRVTAVNTDPLSDDLFTIPAGYTTQ